MAGKDVIEHIVDGQKGPSLALLATKVVHGVKNNAQEALRWDVAGLVGLKPLAIDTSIFVESCSEPLNVLHSCEEPRHKLSFWACLKKRDWPGF